MTTRTCAACDEPVREGMMICRGCTRRTRRNLADQEANRQELLTTLARDTHMTAPNNGGRSAERPLPIDPRAGDLLAEQRALLVAWCRLLHDEHHAPLPADTIAAMACHIENWLDRLALHPAAGELVTELRDLEHRILKVIDYPDERARIPVGPCIVELDDGSPCPGEVEARFPQDKTKPPLMRCRYCNTEWDTIQWPRVGQKILRRMNRAAIHPLAGQDFLRRITGAA
jgi:hypothetical protein